MENDFKVSELLTEEQKEAVHRIHHKLSLHSVFNVNTRTEVDSDPHSGIIGAREAEVLYKVIQTFCHFHSQKHDVGEGDSGESETFTSSDSYDFSYSSEENYSADSVSPGRFNVSVTEKGKMIVKEVHEKIQLEKSKNGANVKDKAEFKTIEMCDRNTISLSFCSHVDSKHQSTNVNITDEVEHFRSDDVTCHVPISDCNAINQCDQNSDSLVVEKGNFVTSEESPPFTKLPAKERFRDAVMKVIRAQRRHLSKKRYYSELWKKRGDAGWLALICTVFAAGIFVADVGFDLKVAADHFAAGDYWWGTLTLMLLFLSAIIVNVMSFLCYKDDKENNKRDPESGWGVVIVTHVLLLGLLERYWRILVKAYRIKCRKLKGVHHYKHHISMNLDVAFLYVILAFTEDAPQLVLQIYILFTRHVEQTLLVMSLRDIWTITSIFLSFISYSRIIVDYVKCLRDSKKDRGRLQWHMYVLMWFWRTLMFTSRILVLVFFATKFPLWLFLVLFVHCVIILVLIRNQKVGFFPGQSWKQNFIRIVISFIHIFCIFVLEAERLLPWVVKYYSLVFVQALFFSLLWFTNTAIHLPWQVELAGLTGTFVCYVLGLLMMIMYYRCLHPKLMDDSAANLNQIRYQRKSKADIEVVYDIESSNVEEEDKDEERKCELWGFD